MTSTQPVWAQQDDAEPTYTVQFNDSDILEVIKFVAEVTGKTMVIDPRVKGRIKIMSSEALTEKELFALFRSVLEISDYTVVEVGDIVRILPLKDARTAPTAVNKTTPADDSEFITQVIQLKNIDAAKVIPVLRPLVPQNSHLAAYPPSNAILITDTRANIDRVNEVIEKIDRAASPVTEVVPLKFADAEDMVIMLQKLESPEAKQQHSTNNLIMVPDARNNSIILSGEEMKRLKAKQLIRTLDVPQKQSGNVRVVYLEYADAKEVAAVLSKVVQNMSKLTPGQAKGSGNDQATVEADEATNALLITASGDMLNSLLAVVHRLDIRRAQVLVEAIIVELTGNDEGQLGVEWLFANAEKGQFGGSSAGDTTKLSVATGLLGGSTDGGTDTSGLANLAGGIAGNQGQILGFAGLNGNDNFAVILSAVRNNNKANILSTPSLLTMDNQEATISVGQNVPFRTGSYSSTGGNTGGNIGNPFTTIQREDVGISLTVTPQVNEGNKILLDISQEVSSLSEGVAGSADLITNQSTITTQILAGDNQTIVLGGLIKDEISDGERRVPLLGSIPVLGNFFKVQSTSHRKSNLMVFLRAKIIRNDETLYGATAEKYRYIQDLQQQAKDVGLRMLSDEKLQVLPDMEAYVQEAINEQKTDKQKFEEEDEQ
ncbi:Type II secretion system protein D [Thalassocella blandensis]|nr:Type II secretion system protein D [Thalassocella blandensis]